MRILSLLALALILTACTLSDIIDVVISPTPTVTPTAILIPTETPTPSATPTATSTPTFTAAPTLTPSPTVTPSLTPTMTVTPGNQPALNGFGANDGGRGGAVYTVASYDALKTCLAKNERRICKITIGRLDVPATLEIRYPYLTLDGNGAVLQSTLPNRGAVLLVYNTHDVILTNVQIHSRATDLTRESPSCCIDGLAIVGSHHVLVDHVSVLWGVDENLSIARSQDITVQWSIIAEALRNAGHEKGSHSMGLLVGEVSSTRVSLLYNLFASNANRNPRLQAGLVDMRYNVVYNASGTPVTAGDDFNNLYVNVVGNVFLRGADSSGWTEPIAELDRTDYELKIYAAGNMLDGKPLAGSQAIRPTGRPYAASAPFAAPEAAPLGDVLELVLAAAGAWPRSTTDARIVAGVRDRSGRIVDKPTG